ncbi:MAG: TonB-dependent receptor [Herminiimonas sp.]|nr:TonB-dependent receptor [Herminiimonas sp.]
MSFQHTLLSGAVASAFATLSSIAAAQAIDATLPTVTVNAAPFGVNEGQQILAPAKVLSGAELREKMGSSLGDTLSNELGVSTSGFGAAASRPIIRGLEGSRVKILENGMSVSDVSGLSNDHAVGAESSTARQIEILRGPAALLYGSGAIGGLVNVVNDRIPTELPSVPFGTVEARYGSVDQGKNLAFSLDGAAGPVALHLDGNVRDAVNYKIPGGRAIGEPAPESGRLPQSFMRQNSVGLGASYIAAWGHVGTSLAALNNRYGTPTAAGSQIDLSQTRQDIDVLVKSPWSGFDAFKFKLGHTDYEHTELDLADVPQTRFANKSTETRWELSHRPLAGWRGTFGAQTEDAKFSAINASDGSVNTVPLTRSATRAVFVVEERDFGSLRLNAGARLESVERKPLGGLDRSFNLGSYSLGGLWEFIPGYGFGSTASIAQRAPATEELYSAGPHDATGTFDRGDPTLAKETSRNIELTLQKNAGMVRWKTNLFYNRVKNFVYGAIPGTLLDDQGNPGDELRERIYQQGNATIRGAEAEISYNLRGEGLSLRAFADTSRGSLDAAGSLPLQPATRFGIDAGYTKGAWRSGIALLHAQKQERLAIFETTATPSYTRLDANLSYTQRLPSLQLIWFASAKNLLNEDIRLSTSVLKDIAPLPGRNLTVGVRAGF